MTVPEAIDFLNGMREYQLALAAKHANQPARAKGAEERAQRLKDVMELCSPPRPAPLSSPSPPTTFAICQTSC